MFSVKRKNQNTQTSPWPSRGSCVQTQEVCATLSIDQSLNYDIVKSTVLRAYELVPEAYRQKIRQSQKAANQTFVEFAREKSALFDKECFVNLIF